jgi:hypothetical protein
MILTVAGGKGGGTGAPVSAPDAVRAVWSRVSVLLYDTPQTHEERQA